MTIKVCDRPECTVEYYVKPHRLKKGYDRYCSKDCRLLDKPRLKLLQDKAKINTVCSRDGCNNEYYVLPSHKKAGRGKYCSHECYSIDKLGTTLSEEHKRKIGEATKQMWKDGVFDSPEIREAYAEQGRSTKGRKHTKETKQKMSEARRGEYPYHLHTPEMRAKALQNRIGISQSPESNKKRSTALKGRIFSEDHKRKLSEAHRSRDASTYLCGDKNPNWKGGISNQSYSNEFRVIKKEIRERDNHECKICGKKQSERFGVIHHMDANKKNNDKKNLILLCRECHGKVHAQRNTNDPMIIVFRSMLKY